MRNLWASHALWILATLLLSGSCPTLCAQTPRSAAESAKGFRPTPQRKHRALGFDGSGDLEYPAKRSLDLERGTLEFYVARGWTGELDHAPCVLACGRKAKDADLRLGKTNTRYAVYLSPDGESIGLWNGEHYDSVDHSFQPGKYHHVALVTSGVHTAVVVDGQCVGVMRLGYGKSKGGKLFIGSSGDNDEALLGSVHLVRIWNRPMTAEQVQALRKIAFVPRNWPIAANLVAYSHFSKRANRMHFPKIGDAEPFRTGIQWHRNLDDARQAAKKSGKMILRYVTGTNQHPLCDVLEQGILLSEDWVEFQKDLVICLEESGAAVDAGRFTFFSSEGESLNRAVIWSTKGLHAGQAMAMEVQERTKKASQDPQDLDNRARLAILRLPTAPDRAKAFQELAELVKSKDVTDDTYELYEGLRDRRIVMGLLAEYAKRPRDRGKPSPAQDPSELVQLEWQEKAYDLYEGLVDPAAIDLETLEFGFLVANHAVYNDVDRAKELLEQLQKFSPLSPMISLRVNWLRKRIADGE